MEITLKLKKYVVVKAPETVYLEREVNDLIWKGYALFGNPFHANGCFHQAMVKYEEEKE